MKARVEGNGLAKLSAARTALSKAKDLKEVLRVRDVAEAVRSYAKAAKLGVDIQADGWEIKLLAEQKAGAMLKEMEKSGERVKRQGGDRSSKPQLQDLGIDKTQSSRWQKLTEIPEPVIAEYKARAIEQGDPSTAGLMRHIGSGPIIAGRHTGEIEWYTPEKYIESVRKVMGGIDLDPASSDKAQKVINAKKYYTAREDGLTKEWAGRVFLNPPFKMPGIKAFVDKLCDAWESAEISSAILLTNDNTDTSWWQRAAGCCVVMCLCAGRISFYNAAGEWSAPTNGQTFFYFGKRKKTFQEEFGAYGTLAITDP